ncbi:MAG: hypothetical protein LCH82_04500 [Actinobacteria bacterium]|nr:hypothetical protein [Actinomycetota bacterium]
MLSVLAAVSYGAVSAFVPVVNAEVYVVAAARASVGTALAVALALAVGQSAGKVVIFETARRGAGCFAGKRATPRWAALVRDGFRRRRTAIPLVLAAATVGVPPLAAVSLAAGAAGQRRWEFTVLCLTGRAARFVALAVPLALA